PPTTELYTLSLHDALPIFHRAVGVGRHGDLNVGNPRHDGRHADGDERRRISPLAARNIKSDALQRDRFSSGPDAVSQLFELKLRSEEHTSELQSRENLVCR